MFYPLNVISLSETTSGCIHSCFFIINIYNYPMCIHQTMCQIYLDFFILIFSIPSSILGCFVLFQAVCFPRMFLKIQPFFSSFYCLNHNAFCDSLPPNSLQHASITRLNLSFNTLNILYLKMYLLIFILYLIQLVYLITLRHFFVFIFGRNVPFLLIFQSCRK